MICDRIKEQIPECLAGRLDSAAREKVIDHLETCSACRADVAELGVVWRGMETMEAPEPSPALRARFIETLNAYQEGFHEAQRRAVYTAPKSFWAGWWPAQPVWQAVFSAALIVASALGGRYLLGQHAPAGNPELAQLKGQVESLREIVALSLLQDQSSSSRLRGVTYSYQIAQPDQEVRQALLHALNHDSNVNVRLSALDALTKMAGNSEVRRAIIDSLPLQDSALVQSALIDALVQIHARDAAPEIRKLANNAEADPELRQNATAALEKLGVSK